MSNKDAKYDQHSKSGTYSDRIHHGEVKRSAKFSNDAPAALGQKLAANKGLSGAKSILSGQFKKK